jgi:integrase
MESHPLCGMECGSQMKATGRHPDRALSALRVRTLTKPGRYTDGNGLYLVIEPSGAKRWILRTVVQGRRRDMGLGSARLVSLADARDKARDLRRIARNGGDPIAEMKKIRRVVPTFAEASRSVHTEHSSAWKNPKHKAQWLNTLSTYAFPVIGERRLDQVDTPDVLKVLSPIWLTKSETARRLKQRIASVLDWAKASGYRSGDNPVDGVEQGLPRRLDRANHHAALPYAEIAVFIQRVRTTKLSEPAKLAFEFLILTAGRTNEVLHGRWNEVDLDGKVWTIPPSRMKASREHRVPLSQRNVEILQRARKLAGDSEFLFPGRKPDEPMSNMIFLMILRRMELSVTAHGFRSAFRDWAAERTNFPREVCEMALAHTIKDKTEAAYRRGDLFEKRRALMNAWAGYATAISANVIPLRTG